MKYAQPQSNIDGEARTVRRIDVTHELASAGNNQPRGSITATVVIPRDGAIGPHPTVLCCVPGGGSSRAYFDLAVENDPSYSFAEFAATRGMITIAVDNLGTGASSHADSFQLTSHEVAQANSAAFRAITSRIREGSLSRDVQPLPQPVTIGVGHSMGGMLTVLGQSIEPLHTAIAALGFSFDGLPDHLTNEELKLSASPDRWNGVLHDLAAKRFSTSRESTTGAAPFPFYLADTSPNARRAVAAARTNLLPLPGLLSMIPGNIREDAESITTPVFLGGGDHEPWHTASAMVGAFPSSSDITFYKLDDAAHNHNVASSRLRLWTRLCQWAQGIGDTAASSAPQQKMKGNRDT